MNTFPTDLFDANIEIKAAGLIATTTEHTAIDLGSAAGVGKVVIDITAIEIASNDELYRIEIQGSADNTTFYSLGSILVGPTEVLTADDPDTTVGRELLYFNNIRRTPSVANGVPVVLRYVRLATVIAGTIATGINYSAYLAMVGHGG